MRLLIAGTDETHLVHTLDISRHGVMLGGFRGDLKVGDTIEIQYHHKKAQFRVAWVKLREGSTEKQVGAESLEPDKRFWEMELSNQPDDYDPEI